VTAKAIVVSVVPLLGDTDGAESRVGPAPAAAGATSARINAIAIAHAANAARRRACRAR
jgi:hypothetical protein